MGDRNENRCPSNLFQITSEEACRSASWQMGYTYGGRQSYPDFPSGCAVLDLNNQAYFNAVNEGAGNTLARLLCAGAHTSTQASEQPRILARNHIHTRARARAHARQRIHTQACARTHANVYTLRHARTHAHTHKHTSSDKKRSSCNNNWQTPVACAHTHKHTRARAQAHTHACTHAQTHRHTHASTRSHIRTHTETNAHKFAHAHACEHAHVRAHARTVTRAHAHADTHARAHTDTHARAHTGTHRQRKKYFAGPDATALASTPPHGPGSLLGYHIVLNAHILQSYRYRYTIAYLFSSATYTTHSVQPHIVYSPAAHDCALPHVRRVCCAHSPMCAALALGRASSNICPSSYLRLDTLEACNSAAAIAGRLYDGKLSVGTVNSPLLPGGCYWVTLGGRVFFNLEPDGSASPSAQLLCARASNSVLVYVRVQVCVGVYVFVSLCVRVCVRARARVCVCECV